MQNGTEKKTRVQWKMHNSSKDVSKQNNRS